MSSSVYPPDHGRLGSVFSEIDQLRERNAKLVAELELAKVDADNLRYAVEKISNDASERSAQLETTVRQAVANNNALVLYAKLLEGHNAELVAALEEAERYG